MGGLLTLAMGIGLFYLMGQFVMNLLLAIVNCINEAMK
jgi:hypothetical protein